MGRVYIQIHEATTQHPPRAFFCLEGGDLAHYNASSSLILIQHGDAQLVADLREAADELEAKLNAAEKEATIKARVLAAMEAEGVA